MYKKLVLLVFALLLGIQSLGCNPIKSADNLLQAGGQVIADTCTPENSFAKSCDNLP